jgi:hypothetical protein
MLDIGTVLVLFVFFTRVYCPTSFLLLYFIFPEEVYIWAWCSSNAIDFGNLNKSIF